MSESIIQHDIRLALSGLPGVVIWRNNVGIAFYPDGSRVRYGLGGPGGSDLIGMVDGRFTSIEVKSATGQESKEQALFRALVKAKGGFSCIARSIEEACEAIERARGFTPPVPD